MTFAISGFSVTSEHPCGDTLHVFDGARRYDVEFKFIQNENLPADEDGYTGPTVKCEVIYKQIAGFKPSVKQGDKTYPIYVWGATFQTQAPGPVRRFGAVQHQAFAAGQDDRQHVSRHGSDAMAAPARAQPCAHAHSRGEEQPRPTNKSPTPEQGR